MKICVQDGSLYSVHGYRDAYQIIRQAGFEAIDWNIDVALSRPAIASGNFEDNIFLQSTDKLDAYFAEELQAIRDAGLTISQAHAPFHFYQATYQNFEKIFDLMVKAYCNIILLCDRVGCKNVIIHGAGYARNGEDKTPDEISAINKKMYTALIPTLQQTNVVVCLENLFVGKVGSFNGGHCANPYEAAREIDELNALAGKECFGLCLDTGHLNLICGDPLLYIPVIGKRLKALHIHDNDGISDMHRAPYTGTINWKHFYTALKQIGYEGDLSFETFKQTDPSVIERELTLPWMTMIAQIGQFFRDRILEA